MNSVTVHVGPIRDHGLVDSNAAYYLSTPFCGHSTRIMTTVNNSKDKHTNKYVHTHLGCYADTQSQLEYQ